MSWSLFCLEADGDAEKAGAVAVTFNGIVQHKRSLWHALPLVLLAVVNPRNAAPKQTREGARGGDVSLQLTRKFGLVDEDAFPPHQPKRIARAREYFDEGVELRDHRLDVHELR